MKQKNGFTYIDVIVAAAIFSIAAISIFAVLNQSFRNMNIAKERHMAHLNAQSIMLIARDNASPNLSSFNDYTIWFIDNNIRYITDMNDPGPVPSFNANMLYNGTMIIVIIWDKHGNIAARAKGMSFK